MCIRDRLGGDMVEVDNAELVAGLLVVQVSQLGHDLKSSSLRFGTVVKVRSALHTQPLAAVVGGADFKVCVVQQLLVGSLVLAQDVYKRQPLQCGNIRRQLLHRLVLRRPARAYTHGGVVLVGLAHVGHVVLFGQLLVPLAGQDEELLVRRRVVQQLAALRLERCLLYTSRCV